jgi:hypothetical protein
MKTLRVANKRLALAAVASALGLLLVLAPGADAASKIKRPTKKITFDPTAEKVDFFDSIESGALKARLVMKDANEGRLLIENPGDQPLSIALPPSMVGVQVLKQFTGGGGGGGNNSGGNDSGGQAQSIGGGGGLGGGGFGGGGGYGGGGGGGFFSVPAEQTVSIGFSSVCLEHGKADPTPRMQYAVKRVEEFSNDPTLNELLKLVGTGKIRKQAAQAAAWRISNKMSWEELAAKKFDHVGRPDEPYFSADDLAAARSLVAQAGTNAREAARETEIATEEAPSNPRGVRTFSTTGETVGTPVSN